MSNITQNRPEINRFQGGFQRLLHFWLKLFGNRDMDKYKEVVETLIRFRDERDWAQFHDSKNLALALLLEASELNELFLWKKESQAEEVNPERLKEELADVLTYSLLLAEKHHLDIFDIVLEKIRKNGEKYPVEKAKGTAKKYTEL